MKKTSQKIWFKSKDYGWGWYPCAPEGWAVTALFAAAVAFNFFRIDLHSQSVSDTLVIFIPETILIIGLFILICYLNGEQSSGPLVDKKTPKKKSKKK